LADGVSFPGTKASGIWVSDLESYPSGENVGAFAGDLTRRFPLIIKALARLRSRSCILDGEAVACDDNGIPSFDRIRCFYRPHSINAQRAGSFAGSSWMVAPSPAMYAEHLTAMAITLRRSKAPRAGRLITPRRKAYQMPRL
jgi:hypothetical protein